MMVMFFQSFSHREIVCIKLLHSLQLHKMPTWSEVRLLMLSLREALQRICDAWCVEKYAGQVLLGANFALL